MFVDLMESLWPCLAAVVVARCRGVEGARVDPVSAWDALCAVQSEEVDVLTGMTLLPAGEQQTAGACHPCMGALTHHAAIWPPS